MLHLLPDYQKKKVIHEYRLRLMIVLLWTLLITVLVFAVFTLPSFLALHAQKSDLQNQKADQTAAIARFEERGNGSQIDSSKAIEALRPYKNPFIPTLYIDALSASSTGINVDGYAFSQAKAEDPVSVVINGFADKREDLSFFSKSLNDVYGNVKLPLSALAKQSDIPFEFRFQMDFAKVDEYFSKKKAE